MKNIRIDLQLWPISLSAKSLAILALMVSGWLLLNVAQGLWGAHQMIWGGGSALHRFSVKLAYRWFGEFGFTYGVASPKPPQERRIPQVKIHLN